jgi:fibro-slime domain-containing protein
MIGCVTIAACGARTELLTPDTCPQDGLTRSCVDACGAGLSRCLGGVWSECEVPVATRSCSDDCGSGQEACVQGTWGACQVPDVQRDCASACGPGHETCRAGKWGACDARQPRPPELHATIRDFSPKTHPDFEAAYPGGLDAGIVQRRLGPDDEPVYNGMPRTRSTSGAGNFDKWYHDDPVNLSAPLDLQLKPSPDDAGLFVYDNHAFFPIDGQLLGNEGRIHNFHFTLEAHAQFEYRGGEEFSFAGDDDMWVFINQQLAIDLGGLHQSLSAHIALDQSAAELGLLRGEVYHLDFFFAERHTTASHFTLRTSIADVGSCD